MVRAAQPGDRFNYVLILMEIDREMFPGMFDENLTPVIEKNVAQGLRARIEPQGVTGINYIEINYVTDPSQFPPLAVDWKPHYYYIPSAPGRSPTSRFDQQYHASDRGTKYRRDEQLSYPTCLPTSTRRPPADISKISADLQTLVGEFREAVKEPHRRREGGGAETFRGRAPMSTVLRSRIPQLWEVLRNLEPATKISGPQIRELVQNLTTCQRELRSVQRGDATQALTAPVGHAAQAKPTPTPAADARTVLAGRFATGH